MTVGVDIAKVTLEAAAWQEGRAIRLGTFEQTAAGWTALRDAVAALQVPPTGPDQEPVAIILEPTGGYELACALWARQQDGWQVHRPNPAARAGLGPQSGLARQNRSARCAAAGTFRRRRPARVAGVSSHWPASSASWSNCCGGATT